LKLCLHIELFLMMLLIFLVVMIWLNPSTDCSDYIMKLQKTSSSLTSDEKDNVDLTNAEL